VTYDFTASQVANQISEPLLLIADDGSLAAAPGRAL
jgi:hypothetical protein